MTGFWKTILIISISILLIVAGYFGYEHYRRLKNPSAIAMKAITNNAMIFVEINSPFQAFNKITKGNDIVKELSSISAFANIYKDIIYLDSVLSTDPFALSILENHKLIISVNKTGVNAYSEAYILELSSTVSSSEVETFIKKINGDKSIVMQKHHGDAEIKMVNISSLSEIFNFTIYKGLFIGSFNENLITDILDQIDSDVDIQNKENFNRIMMTAGENVDANIYLNHRNLNDWTSGLVPPKLQQSLKRSGLVAEWTETDLIIKNSELLINGYTISPDTGEFILNAFRQEPQKISVPEILPYNVSMILHFGFENIEEYISSNFKFGDHANSLKELTSLTKKTYGVDINKDFISWLGSEVAIASIGNGNDIAVLRTNDIKNASQALSDIAEKVSAKNNQQAFSEEFGEYVIEQIKIPGLLHQVLGPVFSNIEKNYFLTIKDYVVFANNPKVLKTLVNDFYNRKTLAENQNYKSFSNNISDKSNIYFYCNIRRSLNCLSEIFKNDITKVIVENQKALQDFEGMALQFSYINKMFYTNIYLKHNPGHTEVNPSNWETELESSIAGQPYFVKNHTSGKLNIIATGELSNFYLLDHLGQIKWQVPLIEKPVSPVYEVDYFNNNQFQFLFNTENYIYLIDMDGNYVGEYPVKLITPATNSMAVFDYENKKDYRLLLALSDNKIYNYDIHAQPVKGWNKTKAKVAVRKAVEHFVQEDKDYLFIRDEKGNVAITNRRGEGRIEVKKNFEMGKNSKIYINKTNSKGDFITTDTKGQLVYISESGKISRTKFNNFSEEHFFLYEDFTGNNSIDFIFIDGDKLIIYDRFKKVIIEEQLSGKTSIPPLSFLGNNGNLQIGIVNQTNNEVTFFDKRGKINNYHKIEGQTPFIIGKLNNDKDTYLIIGLENKVKCYSLE